MGVGAPVSVGVGVGVVGVGVGRDEVDDDPTEVLGAGFGAADRPAVEPWLVEADACLLCAAEREWWPLLDAPPGGLALTSAACVVRACREACVLPGA
jgi:hypothetical protein